MKRKKLPKGFWIYTGLLLIAVLTMYPYQIATLENASAQYGLELPMPTWLMAIVGMIQPFLLGLLGIWIGQSWAPKVGLRSLVYEKTDWKRSVAKDFKKALPVAILSGVGLGVFFIGFDFWMAPVLEFTGQIQAPTISSFLMALLYGGIAEELMLRFGFMTLLVYLFTRFGKSTSTVPYALAIFISAFLFALGHYGATAAVTEMTSLVWFRMLLLNGLGGIVFGWLYYKHHLEAAIVSHMSAHVAMNIIMWGLYILGT